MLTNSQRVTLAGRATQEDAVKSEETDTNRDFKLHTANTKNLTGDIYHA